jgi:glyoxylase-like metal-dependent hydrolase (beta-lactamase superfamily II)
MKTTAPATIENGISIIGDPGLPSYLIHAPRAALIDAGMSFMGPAYARAAEEFLGPEGPAYLCITHSHYDHLGACSFLKRNFPGMRTAGHGLAVRVLQSPGAISTMKHLSDIARQLMNATGPETAFLPTEIDLVLKENDTLDLGGGISITVLETPGHTRDSLTYCIDPFDAVAPGEALGVVQLDGRICPEFLTDFNDYLSSARKILGKNPKLILMPHGPSLSGDDAAEFLAGVIPAACSWRDLILETLHAEDHDIDRSTAVLFERLYDPRIIGQEMNAFRTNLKAKVACIDKLGNSRETGP